jgi:hypothetical protein
VELPPLGSEPPAEPPEEEGGVLGEGDWEPAARDGGGASGEGPPAEEVHADEVRGESAGEDHERVPWEADASSEGHAEAARAELATESRSRETVAEIPIELIPNASYAFITPPGMRYRERVDVLFQVDPTATALQALRAVERIRDEEARRTPAGQVPMLRGAAEATTGPWSRCMEAELHETTVSSRLTALDLPPGGEDARLEICELDAAGECNPDPGEPRRLGLHPTQWRWQVQGVDPGRAQLVLRLYAVAQERRPDGSGECLRREPDQPGTYRRIRTFQRRMTIEVSTAERVEKAVVTPWLWSLLFPPVGIFLALWQRGRARRVLP